MQAFTHLNLISFRFHIAPKDANVSEHLLISAANMTQLMCYDMTLFCMGHSIFCAMQNISNV